ncbi:dihydroorotase family protein [Candidatus Woesearchaeota archaeon]|nr:dihydroorotase family protein [Candidatus Woesearchaeota archaeon]
MSLLIKNGKIYQNGALARKNIFIKNHKIDKITSQDLKAEKTIDAKNKIVIPGLIDSHVHFREPGATHKEDFLTGSMAAAAGGITTVLDMPNTNPATTNLQRLEEKRRLAKKSIVNYGFHFGSTNDNMPEIEKAKNVASVKVYMDFTTGDLKLDKLDVLKKIFTSNKTISVHGENENILEAIELIQHAHNHLYLCHVSSKEELHYAKRHKIKNARTKSGTNSVGRVFVETCPHYLFLTAKDINKLGSFAEMKPGLKTKQDQKALWQGLYNGRIDTIATDHAPHTKEEKMQENYPYGVPGCETMLPLLLNAMNEKKITLKKIVQLCCENPAEIFRIKNKGRIKEGYDADLAIIDLNLEKEVKNDELLTKCKWSPFDGWKLKGWPAMTIVNGNIVFDNGKVNNIKAKEVAYDE